MKNDQMAFSFFLLNAAVNMKMERLFCIGEIISSILPVGKVCLVYDHRRTNFGE